MIADISDEKQIPYILTQNGSAIPVHLIFSERTVSVTWARSLKQKLFSLYKK